MSEISRDRMPNITVSLTSYPPRIEYVHRVVENMLSQTMKPDRIVLWLAGEQFPDGEKGLPYKLKKLTSEGLEIRWCDDWKSYKKLVPSLVEFPDDIIITVDDDLVYDNDLIETLTESYRAFPDAVSTVRTHLMRFNTDGSLCDYKNWRMDYQNRIGQPCLCLFATTGAGTLFPPHVFGPETVDPERFMSLCPKADDVWVKVMQTYYRVPTVLAREIRPLKYIPDTQTATLFDYNLRRGGNDQQLRDAFEYYNKKLRDETLEQRLLLDSPGFCPEFAVIVPRGTDDERFAGLMDSIKAQTRYGIVTLCVCGGEYEKSLAERYMSNDGRTVIIEADPGAADTERIAAGLKYLSDGADYFMVLSERDRLEPEALRQIYNQLVRTPCKLLAMTGAVTGTGCADDMTTVLNYEDGQPVSVEAGGPVGSDLHTKVFHSTLRRLAAPLIGGARLDGTDAQQFAARVLMTLSSDSAIAYPAYGYITRELYNEYHPLEYYRLDAEYITEMNRAGGQLAVQSQKCVPWLVRTRERIFNSIERAENKPEYYAKLCEIFGEPVTISKLLGIYRNRENVLLDIARQSTVKRAVATAAPRRIAIIDLAGSSQLELMLEACLNTVTTVLLLSVSEKAAQHAGGRVMVHLFTESEKNGIQQMLERVSGEIDDMEPDAVQLIGEVDAAMSAVLMLSRIASRPVMMCPESGAENVVPLWELADHVRVIVTGSEEDSALLRLLDKRTAVCVPPTDLTDIKLEEMTDRELSELSERIHTENAEERVSQWKDAYRMLEFIPEPLSKEQPLRRAIRRLTAQFSEMADRKSRVIGTLTNDAAAAHRCAGLIGANLRANIADSARRAQEKEQRLEKNAAEALDRQKRFTDGRIQNLQKKYDEVCESYRKFGEEKADLTRRLREAESRANRAGRELDEIRHSSIYRAGSIVTWLPRKLVLLLRKLAGRNE